MRCAAVGFLAGACSEGIVFCKRRLRVSEEDDTGNGQTEAEQARGGAPQRGAREAPCRPPARLPAALPAAAPPAQPRTAAGMTGHMADSKRMGQLGT